MDRIAKVMARAGVCSRRDAEKMILAGKVKVNGKFIDSPALNVSETDEVEVNGKAITKAKTRLWLFHKPKGCLTTNKDPEGRPTIFDQLPKNMPRVITIGRLDYNTEGLLLLTNDGEFARNYELPAKELPRVYKCRVYGVLTDQVIKEIEAGILIGGVQYRPAKIEVITSKGDNTWLYITITEGKNREVRRVFEHFNLSVSRLIRVSYGDYKLDEMPTSKVIEVEPKEV